MNDLEVCWWPTDKPIPYARNSRKITERAIDKVAASIKEFGWRVAIVVDKDGVIICGHTRLLAAKTLGLQQVPVHIADNLTPAQVKAYRLMDNRSHEETDWDVELLGPEISELKDFGIDLSLTGFDAAEIDTLLAASLDDDRADEAPPASENPISIVGDLWVCGGHRVLCGDATVGGDASRLMNNSSADMVFTDPPYNVDYEGYTEDKLTIQGDRMSNEQFAAFLTSTFHTYKSVMKSGASMYVCHPSSWQREFQMALEIGGFEVRCQIIWAKNTFAWGFGRYKFQHEPIFYCHVAGQSDPWYGDKSQSTLWQEQKPTANRLHPTMKPVELIERALVNSSKAGDVVADLFGGSGSTLVACERRGRKARLMEVDPKYVDVIVTRYQQYSGKHATLESDGRTFDEIAAERHRVVA